MKLIRVYSGNPIDAEIVKEVLEDNGIPVNIKNQLMGSIAPWYVSAGGIAPVDIEVFEKDKQKAELLIAEFNKNV